MFALFTTTTITQGKSNNNPLVIQLLKFIENCFARLMQFMSCQYFCMAWQETATVLHTTTLQIFLFTIHLTQNFRPKTVYMYVASIQNASEEALAP